MEIYSKSISKNGLTNIRFRVIKNVWGCLSMDFNKLSNLELVIFDLDGTLIDSNGVHNNLDVKLVRSLGETKSAEEILIERNKLFKTNNIGDIYLNYCEYLKTKYNSNLPKEEILQIRRDLSKKIF